MTGTDRRVWMQLEGIRARFFELVGVVACGLQLPEQSGSLLSESSLGLGELVEVVAAKDLVEPFGFTPNTADAPACLSRDCRASGATSRPRRESVLLPGCSGLPSSTGPRGRPSSR